MKIEFKKKILGDCQKNRHREDTVYISKSHTRTILFA